jgi:hypothetical protein
MLFSWINFPYCSGVNDSHIAPADLDPILQCLPVLRFPFRAKAVVHFPDLAWMGEVELTWVMMSLGRAQETAIHSGT